MKTVLTKRDGVENPVSWEIPETGAEIWCTLWKRGQEIKPYGDGCHVVIGFTVYHCDELVELMKQKEKDGFTWGIDVHA